MNVLISLSLSISPAADASHRRAPSAFSGVMMRWERSRLSHLILRLSSAWDDLEIFQSGRGPARRERGVIHESWTAYIAVRCVSVYKVWLITRAPWHRFPQPFYKLIKPGALEPITHIICTCVLRAMFCGVCVCWANAPLYTPISIIVRLPHCAFAAQERDTTTPRVNIYIYNSHLERWFSKTISSTCCSLWKGEGRRYAMAAAWKNFSCVLTQELGSSAAIQMTRQIKQLQLQQKPTIF